MMYSFVDTNDQYMAEDLPKEAVCFNDVWLDTEINEFRTLHVQGRELLACEVSDTDVPRADGVVYKGKRYLPRTIVVTYQIVAADEEAFRDAFNKLNQILAAEEAHLIFKDEEDKFFIATKVGNSEVPPGKNCVTGEIEFYCADPFKYSVQEKTVTPTLDGQNTFVVNYEGTYPAKPVFEIDYLDDCGYVAFTDASGRILQFGSVEEADDAFVESQHLITDAMGEQPSGWTLNDGYPVGASSITQAGSFKSTTRHGEPCLEPESYGQGSQWHGPCYTKTIPADGAGGDGAVSCLYGWTHFLVIEGTTACDVPDVPAHGHSCTQEKGCVVSILDKGSVYSRPLINAITAKADAEGIRWQYRRSANGFTDARALHIAAAGARGMGIATPTRYIHCAVNVVCKCDIESVLQMARLFVKECSDNA